MHNDMSIYSLNLEFLVGNTRIVLNTYFMYGEGNEGISQAQVARFWFRKPVLREVKKQEILYKRLYIW